MPQECTFLPDAMDSFTYFCPSKQLVPSLCQIGSAFFCWMCWQRSSLGYFYSRTLKTERSSFPGRIQRGWQYAAWQAQEPTGKGAKRRNLQWTGKKMPETHILCCTISRREEALWTRHLLKFLKNFSRKAKKNGKKIFVESSNTILAKNWNTPRIDLLHFLTL